MTTQTIPQQMTGILLTGHGGFDKLELHNNLQIPTPGENEVLIKVGACAINNTDINTRIGWYSKKVSGDTNSGGSVGFDKVNEADASWSGIPLQFPRIQGADVAGKIVAVGDNVASSRIGERVLVRPMHPPADTHKKFHFITFGSEYNGGFAQYTKALAAESFTIHSNLTDIQLASFPCAYSTAENMIDRANVQAGETVLITGASGGVGSAAVQLVKRRNAKVIAICSKDKTELLKEIGADQVLTRGEKISDALGQNSVDVVLDVVAGSQWIELLDIIRPGGRYAVSGAIAGPIVELDVRTLYLKDLTFLGCTYQPRHIFENIIKYIENNEIKPLVSKSFPLEKIQTAQEEFLAKKYIGKLVLIPSQN